MTVDGSDWSLDLSAVSPAVTLADETYEVSATVTDAAGNSVSDSTTEELVVDTTAPTIAAVSSSTADGSYGAGQAVVVLIQMSEDVTVDTTLGSPTLTLDAGTASFTGAAGNVLTFTYTSEDGDNSSDLDVSELKLNDAVIEDAAGNAVSFTGIATKLSAAADIVIDTTAPTAPTVTPDVTLSLLPVITGTTGTGAALPANETLTVVVNGATYEVTPDSSGNWNLNLATTEPASGTLGEFVSGTYYSVLATVTDDAGNSTSETTINEIGVNTNPLILNIAPAASTPDGTYDINDEIDIEVRVSQPVLVSGGVPTLTLNAGTPGNDAVATFIGDTFSYSDTLLFRYKVRGGDDAEDLDYKATDSLNLGGATIVSDQGNPLFTTTPGIPNLDIPGSVNSISFSNNIVVNTAPPSVERIDTVVPNGSYGLDDAIVIVATLSEIVAEDQTFDVMLDTGRTVTLTTTNTERAEGTYIVQAGDSSADLTVINIPSSFPASVVDFSGYGLLTNLPADNIGSLKDIVIDSTPPTVASFTTSKADGLYGAGVAIDLTVTMSEDVAANSQMDVTLNTGAVVRVVAATAGKTLLGIYTVDGTDTSVEDLSVTSYSTKFVSDEAGNEIASLSLPVFPNNLGDSSDIEIDTSSPTITSISAPDGLYSQGNTITLTAQLSEAIEAGKNIELTLDTGDVITFTTDGSDVVSADYTVGAGDNSTDLSVTKAAASGTVNDAAGNPFHALLPAGLNLSDTSDVVVDTTAPTVVSIVSDLTSLNASQTATLTITLSEDSTNFDVADLAENTSGQFASFSGSGSSYTVEFTPGADFEGTATISVTNASFTDLAGNSFVVGSTVATIDVDTRAPTIIGTPDDSDLSKGETATITFTLSEDSTNFDNTVLTANNGTLSTVSGSGSSYTVVFTPTDDFEGTGGVTIAGGVLTDLAGNPNEASSVDLTIDTLAPTVTINSDKASVGGNDGSTVETATITFTLSEDSSDFDSSDVDIDFGSLSNWNPVSATIYEATFTPDFNFNGPVTVAVNAGTFTDPAGNVNTATTQETIAVNTVRPTISISSAPTTAIGGPNTATITFTLSADSTDFTLSDVAVSGGQLTGLTGSGSSYTATFTPPANSTTTETISVAENVFTDSDGNGNTAATPASILVDTVAPSAPTVNLSASANSPVSKAEATSAFGIVDVTGGEAGATMNVLFTGSNGNSITKSATGPSDSIQLTESDLNTLGDGDVAVTATQTDTAGNESPVSSPLEFVLDSIAPEVTGFSSSSPTGEYGLGATITLIASLSEPAAAGQSFFATLNTGSSVEFTTSAGGLTLTGTYTVAGTHNANPLAIATIISSGSVADTSGNPLSTDLPTQITFDGIEIDTIAPQPATLSLVATDPVSAAEAVAPTGFATVQGEAGASIVVTITGTNGTLTRNPLGTGSAQAISLTEAELPAIGDGLVTLTAVQTDAAGNRQITPDSVITFTLDTTVPNLLALSLGTGVAGGATEAEATQATGLVRLTGEAGSTITVTVTDSAGTQHVLNPIIGTGAEQAIRATIADLSVLADGLLVISAVQTDAAGNTQIIPTELTVVLDRIAPNAPNLTIRDNVSSPLTLGETTDTNGVVNVLGENGATLVVSFSGQNGGFQKNLIGTGFNQPIALDSSEAAILGEGSVVITATQNDAAGNISTQETLSVVIDQTAPEVLSLTLDAQAGFYGEGDSIPLSGTLSEAAISGQILRVVLNVLEADNVTPVVVDVTVAANGTDLAGAYVVQSGHNKDDLSINSFTNDHPSNPVTDVAGNPLLDSSSNSSSNQKSSASSSGFVGGQSSGIVVDTVAPEVIEWITTEGTYVVDDTVMIQLRVNEPAAAGSSINVRTNTLGIFRQDIVLNLDANDPTLFTGQYTVALGERADELVLSVVSANTTDRAGNSLNLGSITSGNQSGRVIRGSISLGDSENGMQWGPDHEDGSPSVLINLSTGVTGLDIGAITLNINGRTISLRDASVSQTSSTNYILRLPQRVASLGGGFTITIWSSDIRSILDPDVGMDDAIEFTLPDAGMNTDSETGSR
ncbi:MAG: beta strand repeat-containing protein [Pirellulales bacterium]